MILDAFEFSGEGSESEQFFDPFRISRLSHMLVNNAPTSV